MPDIAGLTVEIATESGKTQKSGTATTRIATLRWEYGERFAASRR